MSNHTSFNKFKSVINSEWRNFQKLRKKVLRKFSTDDIHDLRISLRRLYIEFKLTKFFKVYKTNVVIKKNLKALINNLGNLRNIDECIIFFNKHLKLSDWKAFKSNLVKKRIKELRRIKTLLQNYNKVIIKIKANLKALQTLKPQKSSEDTLFSYFIKQEKRLSKKIKILKSASIVKKPKKRHQLRIVMRKYRYFLEVVAVITNTNYISKIKQLKKYQTILGKLNDIEIFDELYQEKKLPKAEKNKIKKSLMAEEKSLINRLRKNL